MVVTQWVMPTQDERCGCKIGRIAAEYDLPDVDSWVVDAWQQETSVRTLAEEFNEDVIAVALSEADARQVMWNRTPVYDALHTDELSDDEEIEIRRELERAGIDVGGLASDLVSHQTMYRHLTKCLDASRSDERTLTERREAARETVYALQNRTELVTESTLKTLHSADVTDIGAVEVLVDISVVCSDCDSSMDFETAIEDGCDCTLSG